VAVMDNSDHDEATHRAAREELILRRAQEIALQSGALDRLPRPRTRRERRAMLRRRTRILAQCRELAATELAAES